MKNLMRFCCCILSLAVVAALLSCPRDAAAAAGKLTLTKAVMCESIKDYKPVNPAVVFSIELSRVSCFTTFDPVPKQTYIHHKWYRRGTLITDKRLTINPPSWSSFTSVQLRDADKGPWRVEITDDKGHIMRILRFSITD
jgi:hypothetical protein